MKIALLYGLGEGRLTSRNLRSAAEHAGHRIVADYDDADVIVAHSGGYLFLPDNLTGKHVVLAGPSFAYEGKSLIATQVKKFFHDGKIARKEHRTGNFMYRTLLNNLYLLVQPRKFVVLWRESHHTRVKLPALSAKRVTVIAYRDDPWSGNISEEHIKSCPGYRFVSIDGVHDDLWLRPETYLVLLGG